MNPADQEFLSRAINLAKENVASGGGPFGAVLVMDGKVIAGLANQVVCNHDPTAHAEIQTIRLASDVLKTFDLTGAVLYSSCEPCPMCLGAIYWSRISRVVYASNRNDAADAGFRDALLYREISLEPGNRSISFEQIDVPEMGQEFTDWKHSSLKMKY